MGREFIGRVGGAVEVDNPELRTNRVASHRVGLAMLRYVVKIEPLASMPPEEVARWVGPTLDRYLTATG